MQQETVPQILLRTALRFNQIKDLPSPLIHELMALGEDTFQQRLGEIRRQAELVKLSIKLPISPATPVKQIKPAKKRPKSSHSRQ